MLFLNRALLDNTEQASAPTIESTENNSQQESVSSKGQSTSETPIVPPKEEQPKFHKQFQQLAAKERELQKEREAIKAEREEIAQYKSAKAQAKSDPLAFMQAHGLTYDEVTNFVLSKDSPEYAIKQLEKKLEAKEEAAKAEQIKAQQEADAKREQEAIGEYMADVKQLASEKYELVAASGDYNQVLEVVEKYYLATQKALSPDEALTLVEDYLQGQVDKLLATKKLSGKYKRSETVTSEVEQSAGSSSPKTLSNAMVGHGSPSTEALDKMTDRERIRAIAQQFKF